MVQYKYHPLLYCIRQHRILVDHRMNQSNLHHMNNSMVIDIYHAHTLHHSLEFGTCVDYGTWKALLRSFTGSLGPKNIAITHDLSFVKYTKKNFTKEQSRVMAIFLEKYLELWVHKSILSSRPSWITNTKSIGTFTIFAFTILFLVFSTGIKRLYPELWKSWRPPQTGGSTGQSSSLESKAWTSSGSTEATNRTGTRTAYDH